MSDDTVIRRFDVTDKSERELDKFENGLCRNMNHAEYFTEIKEYKEEQPII